MKTRIILTSMIATAAVLFASCEKETVRNHDNLRVAKSLNVEGDYFNLGWQADTIDINWQANCYWGLEFLAWGNKVSEAGDTTMVLNPAKWMTTPVIYGNGDSSARIFVDANARSNNSRTGYVKVFTGDENVCHMIKVVQAGNPDYVAPIGLEPFDLFMDFTSDAVKGWPTTSQSVGDVVYSVDGVDYTCTFGRCNIGNYLVIHNADAYFGVPAVENYKLTQIIVTTSSNNSKARGAKITADTAGTVIVGDEQAWPATPNTDIVYDLHDTDYNTMYYVYCTLTGLPVGSMTLHYEP